MSWMSCCRTTGRPSCRTLLMTCEGACPQMPCSPPRALYTARWCIAVLVSPSSTFADPWRCFLRNVDGADAAVVSANAPRGQLPVRWGSGGFSVWDWNHESIILRYLWFLQNCPSGSEHINSNIISFVTPPWQLSSSSADFISHSFSIPELQFIFQTVLPDLNGRVLVDVGSRLGAVLYGVSRSKTGAPNLFHIEPVNKWAKSGSSQLLLGWNRTLKVCWKRSRFLLNLTSQTTDKCVCLCVFSGLFVQFSLPADWFRDQWRICQTAEWNCGKVSDGRQNQGNNNTERTHTHNSYAISREYTYILWGVASWRVSCSVGSTHWCASARKSSSEHWCSHHEQRVWVLHGAKWASQVRRHWTRIISERSVCVCVWLVRWQTGSSGFIMAHAVVRDVVLFMR